MSNRETATLPIGIILSPADLQAQEWLVANPETQSDLDRVRLEINAFLATEALDNLFAEGDLLFDEGTGLIYLQSPQQTTAIVTGREIKHLSKNEVIRQFQLRGLDPELKEGQILDQVLDLGNGFKLITFALALPKDGLIKESIFSSIMLEKNKNDSPALIVGGGNQEKQQFVHRANEISFSREIYQELDALISAVEVENDCHFARLSQNLIVEAAGESNVERVEFWTQNVNYFGVIRLHLKDGGIKSLVLNRGKLENGQLREGAAHLIHTKIDGKLHINLVKQNRLQSEAAVELPRGFVTDDKYATKDETGTPEELLAKNQAWELPFKQDPDFSGVRFRLRCIEIPAATNFNPENKRQESPLKKMEDLVPSWMSLDDVLSLIKQGEGLIDAHSLAILATFLAKEGFFELRPGAESMTLALEEYQDLIAGDWALKIPKIKPHLFARKLKGSLSPDSGSTRIKYEPKQLSQSMLEAEQMEKSLKFIALAEIWQDIAQAKYDIVSTASIFKFLLENNLLTKKPAF